MIKRGPVSRLSVGLISSAFLIFSFAFPRLIVGAWGKADPWTSYFYMYGIGGFFFTIGLYVIIKSGSYTPNRGNDDFWFKVLIAGFIFFASIHAIWIYLALNMPYKGE